MFRQIAEAYAALSEDSLKQRYDGGEDVREEACAKTPAGCRSDSPARTPPEADKTAFKVDPKSWGAPDPETGRRTGKAYKTDPETGNVQTEEVVMEPVFEKK